MHQNTSFILKEEFVKVTTKLYFIPMNYDIIKMSKQKHQILTIDQVMNDINGWLVDEDYDQDEVEDDLGNFCWEVDEENKINSDPTE